MSVVAMAKLKLIGLAYEQENILSALHKTRLIELKEPALDDGTFTVSDEKRKEELKTELDRINRCLDFIQDRLDKSKKADYYPKEIIGLENVVMVGYDEFTAIAGNAEELLNVVTRTEEFRNTLAEDKAKTVKLNNHCSQLAPYFAVKEKFSDFKDTVYTKCYFGTVQDGALEILKEYASQNEIALTVYGVAPSVILAVALKEKAEELQIKLGEVGFTKCPFNYDMNAKEKTNEIYAELKRCYFNEENINKEACALAVNLRSLKILADYYKFELEKLAASEKFSCTAQTFTLEGYLPAVEKNKISEAVKSVSNAVFVEFSEPTDDETPPTLLKNNKTAAQAEFVTNMYSSPDYREFDPNGFVFVFFMIFFGLIMADIGYGILLMLIGFVMRRRIKIENGTKKLMSIIMYGGFFTVIFGALFGSCFGFSLYTFLPDPSTSGDDQRTNVLTILLGCMALGLIQITCGYILKTVNEFRKKNYWDGIFDGLVWVFFNIGLFCAVFNFLTGFFKIVTDKTSALYIIFDKLQLPGLILAGVSLLIAVVTAGRHEKGFGKFTKGFGAVYGIINLLSDVLSYARLFGLMLSGMMIAKQFNDMGLSLISGGSIGYALGPLVMVIGHTFNIAMGVLGAYIHDCRLQYIEFFSKFYTGEGRLFTPLGSEFEYIYLTK